MSVKSVISEWRPLDWACGHGCLYCPEFSSIIKKSKKPVLREGWTRYPSDVGDAVFVCPDTDLFAEGVPDTILDSVLEHALGVDPGATFVFGTKNPARVVEFWPKIPRGSYISVTVESDVDHGLACCPPPLERLEQFKILSHLTFNNVLAIKPIARFSAKFAERIEGAAPAQVCIGHEAFRLHGFPTPPFVKVMELANRLSAFSDVNVEGVKITEAVNLRRWPPSGVHKGAYWGRDVKRRWMTLRGLPGEGVVASALSG